MYIHVVCVYTWCVCTHVYTWDVYMCVHGICVYVFYMMHAHDVYTHSCMACVYLVCVHMCIHGVCALCTWYVCAHGVCTHACMWCVHVCVCVCACWRCIVHCSLDITAALSTQPRSPGSRGLSFPMTHRAWRQEMMSLQCASCVVWDPNPLRISSSHSVNRGRPAPREAEVKVPLHRG